MHSSGYNFSALLTTNCVGQTIRQFEPRQALFSQGDAASSVFFIHRGRAKLTVVSHTGKEATITLLGAEDFAGEDALTARAGRRMATATTLTPCTALEIEKREFARMAREEPAFADFFMAFLLTRSMRTQADLVDQLFNSSEKRLARILLLMAGFGEDGEPETLIPKISQETLAEMVGTTRSRVSFFMNRFRDHGFIAYDGRIRVHRSLLALVLHDQAFENTAISPAIVQPADPSIRKSRGICASRSAKDSVAQTMNS